MNHLNHTANMEDVISSPFKSFEYALTHLMNRFPEGEAAISQNAYYAYFYAKDVIQGRWAEAEDVIAGDGYFAALYARNVIRGRWVEAEPMIAQDAKSASEYAIHVLKERWIDVEALIATDAQYSLDYAHSFFKSINTNQPSVIVDAIARHASFSFLYAFDVVDGRFELGEDAIYASQFWSAEYISKVLKNFEGLSLSEISNDQSLSKFHKIYLRDVHRI